jgi:hypothetical protein
VVVCRECVPIGEVRRPLLMGRPLHWDGRFVVTARPAPVAGAAPVLPAELAAMSVRRVTDADWTLLVQHNRRLKSAPRSYPHAVRLSLPLVADSEGGIVAVPHLGFFATNAVRFTAVYAPRHHTLDTAYLEEPYED